LWPRQELLAWAARHPELADEDDGLVLTPPCHNAHATAIKSPHPVKTMKHNSQFFLWDGLKLLNVNPKLYAALVLILPASLVALLVALTTALWAAVPVFFVAFIAAWICQYFFFQ
jgi:hypothetical protein